MSQGGRITVELGEKQPRGLLADLVMAWAQDAATGAPIYILELGTDRRGAKCGCICVGCGESLTAVNAAKTHFIRRPHFRHPDGVEHGNCMVLAARAAALRLLHEGGWIELPRHRKSAHVAGLSGAYYEAWVERPAEKLHISQVDYRDRATAIVTFDDGRTVWVDLTGSPASFDSVSNTPAAAISISVDDLEIAAMDPQALRERLTLLPDTLCWRAHWADEEMLRDAGGLARREAQLYLDEVPDGLALPEGMDKALMRETVLHHEAKSIILEHATVSVPGFEFTVEAGMAPPEEAHSWTLAPDVLKLAEIQLEQPFGELVPDVTCSATSTGSGRVFSPAFIEVTVSNAIDGERLSRIRAHGQLALEIDLSLAGGRVTREELRRLIVDEVATKRWLWHPEIEEQRQAIEAQVHARAKYTADVLATPIESIALEYLQSVEASLRYEKAREEKSDAVQPSDRMALDANLATAIDKLNLHGYPEASNRELLYQHGILDRMLSIRRDEGVGYRLKTGQAVLNAILQDHGADRSFHSLYLIAAIAFQPKLNPRQREWFDTWRSKVRDSIRLGETTFLRSPVYDRLLTVLFPALAEPLAKAGGRLNSGGTTRSSNHVAAGKHRTAVLSQMQPHIHNANWKLQDTDLRDGWLKGRDLERWKLENPAWARLWSEDKSVG